MATPWSILARIIPRREEPGGYGSGGRKESDTTDATEHTCILCCTTSKLPRLTQKVKKNFKKKYILNASKKNISLYDCTNSLKIHTMLFLTRYTVLIAIPLGSI